MGGCLNNVVRADIPPSTGGAEEHFNYVTESYYHVKYGRLMNGRMRYTAFWEEVVPDIIEEC